MAHITADYDERVYAGVLGKWRDYVVSATLTPHLAQSFGLAARVQGLERYYALRLVREDRAQLVRRLDGAQVLAEAPFPWTFYKRYAFELQVEGQRLRGSIDGQPLFDLEDESLLTGGGAALLVEEGHMGCDDVMVRPVG